MTRVDLPTADGRLEPHRLGTAPPIAPAARPPRSRVAYAAAHVVADPWADGDPPLTAALDWDATLAFRRHLWDCGLGVADAMDTAQRGMGLPWAVTRELIARSGAEACAVGGALACGASTDQLPADIPVDVADVVGAYEQQFEVIEAAGARVVMMASRHLARIARDPDTYADVYGRLLAQATQPVIVHWLGEMFDPQLAGYWGRADAHAAADVVVDLLTEHADRVAGIKVSLLDADLETRLRARLPAGVRLFTGDDFAYPELIAGDGEHHSDALLGIFDPIAPVASRALGALDAGDLPTYHRLLAPTVPLAHEVFRAPTRHYKTGVVFLAYLAGHQEHFRMVGGLESARSVLHLAHLLRLADAAGLIPDPDLAAARMRSVLRVAGMDA